MLMNRSHCSIQAAGMITAVIMVLLIGNALRDNRYTEKVVTKTSTIHSNSKKFSTPSLLAFNIFSFLPSFTTSSTSTQTKRALGSTPPPGESHESLEWMQIGTSIDGPITHHPYHQPIALSYDASRLVIGSTWFGYSSDPGSANVCIFDFERVKWGETGKISGKVEERFGRNIALSGNGKRLAIAAYKCDKGGNDTGCVKVYEFSEDDGWTLLGKELSGLESRDHFGRSIAISKDGNSIAIAAPSSDLNGDRSGSVHSFEYVENDWTKKGQVIVGSATDVLGRSAVALSADGNIIAIGAPFSDDNGTDTGYALVYQYHPPNQHFEGQWIQLGKTLRGEIPYDKFGESVSISAKGDIIAISAPWHKHTGYVKMFRFKDNMWQPMGQTLKGEEYDYFGSSLSLSPDGNRVAITSDDDNGGNVKVFEYDGKIWVGMENALGATASETYFGNSISMSYSGDYIAVGSVLDNEKGHVRVYELS